MSITSKVPMGQKIAFGFGMLANQMFPAVVSISATSFADIGVLGPTFLSCLAYPK